MARRTPASILIVLSASCWLSAGCSDDSDADCEQVREELGMAAPSATASWKDIEELHDDLEVRLQLRREDEQRCE